MIRRRAARHAPRAGALLLLALATAAAPASAQPGRPAGAGPAQAEEAPVKPPAGGGWVNGFQRWATTRPGRLEGIGPAGARALEAAANAVVDAVAGSRVATLPPDTVCVGVQGSVSGEPAALDPYPGRGHRFDVEVVVPGRRRGGTECGEGHVVRLRANDPGMLVRRAELRAGDTEGSTLRDRSGAVMYEGPNAVGDMNGVTRFYAGGVFWVILTRRAEPLFHDVSAERYLAAYAEALERQRDELRATAARAARAAPAPSAAAADAAARARRDTTRVQLLRQVAELEKAGLPEQAARMRQSIEKTLDAMEQGGRVSAAAKRDVAAALPAQVAKGDAALARLVGQVRAVLDSLSPAERAAPACQGLKGRQPAYLVACDDPWAARVVTVNPRFMDRSLPPEAVQILVASTLSNRRREDRGVFAWRQRVFEELDYAAMRRLLR